MSTFNVREDVVIPETPKVVPDEVRFVYIPKVTPDSPGIATFNKNQFNVIYGNVSISNEYLSNWYNELRSKIPIYTPETIPENPPENYIVVKEDSIIIKKGGEIAVDDIEKLLWVSSALVESTSGSYQFDKNFTFKQKLYCYGETGKTVFAVDSVDGVGRIRYFGNMFLNNKDVATQEYVSNYAVQKLENNDSVGKVYMVEKNSSEPKLGCLSVTNYPNSILRRNQNSQVEVGTPINDFHAANKLYVDAELAKFDFIKVVEVLPETGLPNKIYFVPKADSQNQDLFDEYIWVNEAWEWVTTKQLEVDLTPYATKEWVEGVIPPVYTDDVIEKLLWLTVGMVKNGERYEFDKNAYFKKKFYCYGEGKSTVFKIDKTGVHVLQDLPLMINGEEAATKSWVEANFETRKFTFNFTAQGMSVTEIGDIEVPFGMTWREFIESEHNKIPNFPYGYAEFDKREDGTVVVRCDDAMLIVDVMGAETAEYEYGELRPNEVYPVHMDDVVQYPYYYYYD